MTRDEMLDFGDRIAAEIIRANVDSATEPELARLTILISCQLALMGQLFAEDAGLDSVLVFREELERASRWHDHNLVQAAATPRA
jgi:hypothetical protein